MRLFCLLVGAMDMAAGLLLISAPETTMRLMMIPAPEELVLLRMIGVFVLGVGSSYMLPFLQADRLLRGMQMRYSLVVTGMVRTLVALFVTVCVVTAAMAPGWVTVAVVDGGCAALQFGILWRAHAVVEPL